MKYQNPVIPGFNPDPSVCRVGDDFYLVTSSFEFFPGVPLYHSKNLVNWEHIGYCLDRESQLPLENCRNSGGIYAPTIRYNAGTFYMTTTNVTVGGNFIVKTDDPGGKWSEPIYVKEFKGIDPTLFFDDDGKVYYATNEGMNGKKGIVAGEIDIETGKLIGSKKFLWAGTGGRSAEAPHLYKYSGYYYLIIAEGGTEYGHSVTCARSREIFGEYQPCPRNPILTHRNAYGYETTIQGTGHMDIVQDQNGNWWSFFLGFRTTESFFHHLGRETFLAPMRWHEDGYPEINGGQLVKPDMETQTDLPGEAEQVDAGYCDRFEGSELNNRWNFLRCKSKVNYKVGKGLTITSNGTDLDTLGTPAFITVRQTDMEFEAFCKMKACFKGNSRFGITVFYDNTRQFDIFTCESGVRVTKTFDDIREVTYESGCKQEEITFYVKGDKDRYYFGFGKDEADAKNNIVAKGLTRHLSTEVSKISFTGVYLGIFADGDVNGSATAVYFRYNGFDGK